MVRSSFWLVSYHAMYRYLSKSSGVGLTACSLRLYRDVPNPLCSPNAQASMLGWLKLFDGICQ